MSATSADINIINHDAHAHEHHDTGGDTVFGFWLYF